jgi:hypothetical protein
MPRIKYTVEHIITKLREAEVALSKGQTVVQVSRSLGITEQLRDELLNGEIFETRWEATVLIERWRRTYNQIRPHSSLGYQPPAPEAREPRDAQCAWTNKGCGTTIGGRSIQCARVMSGRCFSRCHQLQHRVNAHLLVLDLFL